jgi:hypothetical protein
MLVALEDNLCQARVQALGRFFTALIICKKILPTPAIAKIGFIERVRFSCKYKELPLKFEFFFITDRFYQSTWVST